MHYPVELLDHGSDVWRDDALILFLPLLAKELVVLDLAEDVELKYGQLGSNHSRRELEEFKVRRQKQLQERGERGVEGSISYHS